MNQKSLVRLTSLFVVASAASASFATGPTITVIASLAPNVYGSPSWEGYRDNALYALENGLSSYGSGPAGYAAVTSPIDRRTAVVTGFNSWLGNADPGTVFGSEYANELGNRMHFGLHIMGNGIQFSVDNLGFQMHSFGDEDGLKWGWGPGNNPLTTYSANRIGINYGVDGIKGTEDDIIYKNNESASLLVDELMYVGSGNSYAAYTDTEGLTLQDKINYVADAAPWYKVVGEYTLNYNGGSVSNSAQFNAVPEPASAAVLLLGLLAFKRRRKQ